LVGLILLQTMLGTLVRQLDMFLLTHISVAVIVVLVAVGVGARAWGLHAEEAVPRRLGLAVMLVVLLQVQLGIVSIAFRTPPVNTSPSADELLAGGDNLPVQPLPALITTIHQTTAAVFLGMAVVLSLWTWRLREAGGSDVDENAHGKPATAPVSRENAPVSAQTMVRE
jgi:heme A synthase